MAVDIHGENVVTLSVPAGTYAINAAYTIENLSFEDSHAYACSLNVNGTSIDEAGSTLGDDAEDESETGALTGATTVSGVTNAITVNCDTPGGTANASLVAVSGLPGN